MSRIKNLQYGYSNKSSTVAAAAFAAGLKEASVKEGAFDTAASLEYLSGAVNQSVAPVPKTLQAVLDEVDPKSHGLITRAIMDGVSEYEEQHGVNAPADLVELALHCAYGTTNHARRGLLDSANSGHQDNLSLQPNRAIVAILAAFGDAIPYAHYLPADINSNEAKLAIMSHVAGNTYGQYAANALMDGIASGDSYVSSARVHKANSAGDGTLAAALTTIQTTDETCNQASATVNLVRGGTIVYVNGIPAAREVSQTGSGASAISGSITIGVTTYTITGTINTDTGVYSLAGLPFTVPVTVRGFVDYERAPQLVPSLISQVDVYSIFARAWRTNTSQSIDARTQMQNELRLDPYSESVIAIQGQFANERHFQVLGMMRRIAINNAATHDFAWATRSTQLVRNQIWQDFSATFGAVSQKMAEDTLNHGVTNFYVGKNIAAQFQGLPREVFEPSGVAERPGIFRVGRWLDKVDVYYTPKGLTDAPSGGQILCVGRATDVTRNPVVLGDAVPPTVIPLSVGGDLKQGAGFYARNFTEVNPHGPSSLGAAMITITNLG